MDQIISLGYPSPGSYPAWLNIFGYEKALTFYAFCLLGGGIVAMLLSNYRAHKRGYPSDIYDTIFLWAFPAGVVGSRVWYVIAMWGDYFYNHTNEIFWIKDGGLAIQGGVVFGALAGIAVVLIRRKGWDVFEAADIAVPTILIAQAIGRWGNFFNQEVYGQIVSESAWGFLPGFINSNMVIEGSYRVPLFLLEGVINLGGFFLLSRFIPLAFGKRYKSGDSLSLYLSWYGLVRFLLEPLRNSKYNMGYESGFLAASQMAIAFMVLGIIGLFLNHGIRYYLQKRRESDKKPAASKSAAVKAVGPLYSAVREKAEGVTGRNAAEGFIPAPVCIDATGNDMPDDGGGKPGGRLKGKNRKKSKQ